MVHLDPYIEILADPSRSLEIEDLQEESMWKKFTRYEGRGRPNFGYSYSFYWIRFQVHNTSSIDEWLLELDSPKINTLQLYQYDADTDQWTMKQTGNGYPFLERDVLHRNLVYKIHLPINEVETIYLRVISGSSKQVPLTLWQPSAHNYKSQVEYTFFGTIFGISLVMALYNLFLYFSVGDRNYLFYVLFVVLNTGLFLSDTGLGYQFIWPELVLWAGRSVTAFMLLSNIGAILFAVHFLETKRYAPRIDIIMKVHMSLVIAVFLVCLLEIVSDSRWFDWRVINLYITVASAAAILITITLLMIAAIRALHSGYRPARYFLIAWGVFTLGVISSLLVDVGILPLIPITKYAWQVSTLLEMVLLSFALGDRIRLMREEKEAAVLESQRSQQMVMESLQRMDKLKDEFLANTSHELRTPLHGIIGIAETLRDGVIGEISSPMKNQLTMIISSGKRLSALINDILDLSKLKNDEIKLKLASVNLPELIDVVLTICQPLVRDKPVELINQVASDIPRVHADENRVQQILYNLVGNAIKHTSRGTIIVSATVAAGRVEITVTDTGKGIPEQELDSIFDPFHQVDPSSTRGASGAGIGLSITKKLVELHQGEIRVYSAVGQGTSFSFTLPISDESIRATEEAAITVETRSSLWVDEVSMMTPATRDAKKRNVRVLIADDEPVNLQVLTNQLVLEGFDVVAVGDGQAVIEHVQHHELGGDDYITKPFDFRELKARIEANLRRYQIVESSAHRDKTTKIQIRDLVVDMQRYQFFIRGKPIELSTKEAQLLMLFVRYPNRVWNADQLYDHVWGLESTGNIDTVKVHISNLRRKLESDPARPQYIQTIRGIGYIFVK